MLIHQAIYGEQGGAHVLLTCSAKDLAPFRHLTGRTDRPSNPPPNINWEPYFSGYAFETYYIISITSPDFLAPRAGMVITHALVLDLEGAIQMENIRHVLSLLPSCPEKKERISSITIQDSDVRDLTSRNVTEPVPLGYSALVKALLNHNVREKPIVWIGQEGFTEVVMALWTHLWPGARKNLCFRLSFGPQDIEGQGLLLVMTPAQLESRWIDYSKVRESDTYTPESKAEAFLHGLPGGEALRNLFSDLGVPPAWVADLKKAEACCNYLTRLTSADEARALVRLLGVLSPAPDKGIQIKLEALEKLSDLSKKGSASDILALRNLDVLPYRRGTDVVRNAIDEWIASVVSSASSEKSEENARLVARAFESSDSTWHKNVQNATIAALADWKPGTALTLWKCWQSVPELVEVLDESIPDTLEIEKELVRSFPGSLPSAAVARCLNFTKKRHYYLLHAAVLGATHQAVEAFREQLAFDKDPTHYEGLRILSGSFSSNDTLKVALDTGDIRLLKLAGEACAETPDLLTEIDVEKEEWRTVWLYSIEISNSPLTGIPKPDQVVHTLINQILTGERVDSSLLLHLASTSYGDLIDNPRRQEIWQRLDPNVAKAFLNVTADAWLERFKVNPDYDDSVEPPLEGAILDEQRLATCLKFTQPNSISLGVNLFKRFNRLTERKFKSWLSTVIDANTPIDPINSMMIGRLILSRGWRHAASELCRYEDSLNRGDLLPALHECRDLLGLFALLKLRISGKLDSATINEDSLWNAILEIVIKLYPHGPEEQHIWPRSGGDISNIDTSQAGRSQWGYAIQLLRKGGGGTDISAITLLKTMKEDYPNNDNLNLLEKLVENKQ
jgi:hypothetical protein